MLECGLPSPAVGPGAGHGWQGLPSNTSCLGSLTALHVPSPLFLLCAVCLSLVLSTQLTSLAAHKTAGARGLLLFLESWSAKPGAAGDWNPAAAGRARGVKLTAYVAILLKSTREESHL